ncbi:MAG: hypothetical protein FJZ90_01100 [Chloroflexi bacterium]|nr:hypothetical protein [Chloroflexota bacterium]
MIGVRGLETQKETFWRDAYRVSEEDIDFVVGLILEAGKPQKMDTLAMAVVLRHLRREKEAAARQVRRGRIYRPVDRYQIDEELFFTALEKEGTVVGVRPGYNPRYGAFEVVRVAFGNGGAEREFAAGLDQPHPLNRPLEELLVAGDAEMSEADVVGMAEPYAAAKLQAAFEADEAFVWFNGTWFLRELLPEVHVGYLNLAEAMIYEAGHPLEAREMLGELGLGETASVDAQLFALNHALSGDERFDNLGAEGSPIWYLRALVPQAALERPPTLRPAYRAAGGEYVGITMLDLVDELGDELDDIPTAVVRPASEVRFEITFPHLFAGTMPATQQFLRMLPSDPRHHFPVTLVDANSRQRLEVWVVPTEGYAAGLGAWYESVGMCVGGQVTIAPMDEPGAFSLSVSPVRSRRSEWIRTAQVSDDGLTLQMQRASIGIRCDRNMLIEVPNRGAVAAYMAGGARSSLSLGVLIRRAVEELAKLSSRGLVHAKSVYSFVNLIARTGSVPVFAELTRNACFDPVGDGFWAYDPSLEGTVYRTAEDMRERPRSQRDDLVRDQVVQYVGR